MRLFHFSVQFARRFHAPIQCEHWTRRFIATFGINLLRNSFCKQIVWFAAYSHAVKSR